MNIYNVNDFAAPQNVKMVTFTTTVRHEEALTEQTSLTYFKVLTQGLQIRDEIQGCHSLLKYILLLLTINHYVQVNRALNLIIRLHQREALIIYFACWEIAVSIR